MSSRQDEALKLPKVAQSRLGPLKREGLGQSKSAKRALKWLGLDVERGRNVLSRLSRSDSAGTLYS